MKDFEAAELVWPAGAFTAGIEKPTKMRKENGYWIGDFTLPKGKLNTSSWLTIRNI